MDQNPETEDRVHGNVIVKGTVKRGADTGHEVVIGNIGKGVGNETVVGNTRKDTEKAEVIGETVTEIEKERGNIGVAVIRWILFNYCTDFTGVYRFLAIVHV